ncbi:ribosome maturation factor RimM [Halobacteriovorax sp. GB3]|uniref:ribosome maturation factor RimM n=1 Tax=Halobacteriovorax sp. GB3 TaxID=2719615 RepID=UPI00236089A6|nr:ribosome maturation factor RimM [Halobacteriovorax sp. GB3]MDD0852674.1 ribosome maturation factor RimM [Halobacteriovorax sp. GB3]
MEKDKLIELGQCSKPHGIKGAFSFHLTNVVDSVLQKGTKIFIFPKTGASCVSSAGEEVEISKISFGNKVIAELKGVSDRNKVESMLPFTIHIGREEFPDTDEDEVYLSDLLECDVYEYETDQKVGSVYRYYESPAHVVLSIRGSKSFEVPFVEKFVPEIDIENRKIWVVIPRVI